jgi:hypothetical protein
VPARCYGHGANEETTARSAAWVCVLADVVGGNGSSDARTSATGPGCTFPHQAVFRTSVRRSRSLVGAGGQHQGKGVRSRKKADVPRTQPQPTTSRAHGTPSRSSPLPLSLCRLNRTCLARDPGALPGGAARSRFRHAAGRLSPSAQWDDESLRYPIRRHVAFGQ